MGAATFGTLLTVDIMKGVPEPEASRTSTWEVPAIDGYGLMLLGQGDAEFTLRTASYINAGSDPGAQTFIATAKSVQGAAPMTITDNTGTTWPGVFITKAKLVSRQPCIYHGAQCFRVEFEFTCVTT